MDSQRDYAQARCRFGSEPVPYQVWSILCVNMPKQGGVPCNMVIWCPLRADSIGLIPDHLCVIETQTANGSTE